jgi:hypothetical protein
LKHLPYVNFIRKQYSIVFESGIYKQYPNSAFRLTEWVLPKLLCSKFDTKMLSMAPAMVIPFEGLWIQATKKIKSESRLFKNGIPDYITIMNEWSNLYFDKYGFYPLNRGDVRQYIYNESDLVKRYSQKISESCESFKRDLNDLESLYFEMVDFEINNSLFESKLDGEDIGVCVKSGDWRRLFPMPEWAVPYEKDWWKTVEMVSFKNVSGMTINENGVIKPDFKRVVCAWVDRLKKNYVSEDRVMVEDEKFRDVLSRWVTSQNYKIKNEGGSESLRSFVGKLSGKGIKVLASEHVDIVNEIVKKVLS